MSEPGYAKLGDIRQGFSLSRAGECSPFQRVSLVRSHFSCSRGGMRIRCSELEEGSLSHPSCPRLQLEKRLRVCNMVTGRWTFHPSSITGQLLRGGKRGTEKDCVDRTALLVLWRWHWRYGLVNTKPAHSRPLRILQILGFVLWTALEVVVQTKALSNGSGWPFASVERQGGSWENVNK